MADIKNPGSRGGHPFWSKTHGWSYGKISVGGSIGRTDSGKRIFPKFDHPEHKNFTANDHTDASYAHHDAARYHEREAKRIEGPSALTEHRKLSTEHRALVTEHEYQENEHAKLAYDLRNLKKSGGEGSRGGRVVGHTDSGKPIYAGVHPSYEKWTSNDHLTAAEYHQVKSGEDEAIPEAIEHHRKMRDWHAQQFTRKFKAPSLKARFAHMTMNKSAGEGSHGGKIIGHTSSGKAIYEPRVVGHDVGRGIAASTSWKVEAPHETHASFTKNDHLDAAYAHIKATRDARAEPPTRGAAHRAKIHNTIAHWHLNQAKSMKKSLNDLEIITWDEIMKSASTKGFHDDLYGENPITKQALRKKKKKKDKLYTSKEPSGLTTKKVVSPVQAMAEHKPENKAVKQGLGKTVDVISMDEALIKGRGPDKQKRKVRSTGLERTPSANRAVKTARGHGYKVSGGGGGSDTSMMRGNNHLSIDHHNGKVTHSHYDGDGTFTSIGNTSHKKLGSYLSKFHKKKKLIQPGLHSSGHTMASVKRAKKHGFTPNPDGSWKNTNKY